MSWGEGIDPVSVFGKESLAQDFEETLPEGQHIFPELAEMMAAMGPSLGEQRAAKQKLSDFIQFTGVRIKVFNVGLDGDRAELEALMLLLAQGEGCLVCREETAFTKDGSYLVALKWAEYKTKRPAAAELIRQTHAPGPPASDTEGESVDDPDN